MVVQQFGRSGFGGVHALPEVFSDLNLQLSGLAMRLGCRGIFFHVRRRVVSPPLAPRLGRAQAGLQVETVGLVNYTQLPKICLYAAVVL